MENKKINFHVVRFQFVGSERKLLELQSFSFHKFKALKIIFLLLF